jgi:Tfp pilus assembly protein PilV
MNRAATLTLNAPLLMLVAALALSTPFFAGAAPAFLDYAQQQTQQSQAQEKTMPQAQSKRQESRQSADNKKTGQYRTIAKKNRQPAGGDCTKR